MQQLFYVMLIAAAFVLLLDAIMPRAKRPFTYHWPYTTPSHYKCVKCGAANCKLWRMYQSCYVDLHCAECAAKEQKVDISTLDERGYTDEKYGRSDSMGWRIPAVPTVECDTYWGYTSVPQDGCDWWYGLPSLPPGKYETLLAPEKTRCRSAS